MQLGQERYQSASHKSVIVDGSTRLGQGGHLDAALKVAPLDDIPALSTLYSI